MMPPRVVQSTYTILKVVSLPNFILTVTVVKITRVRHLKIIVNKGGLETGNLNPKY